MRLPRLLARLVCAVNGHRCDSPGSGWAWAPCRTCGRVVRVYRSPR